MCGSAIWIGGDHIPCPHFKVNIVGRSRTHASAIASAAYQSGEKLYSEFDHKARNYPERNERILYTEIILPDNAPRAYYDRQTLWNSVEINEKSCKAQYCRRFVMALPRELPDYDNLEFVKEYCQQQFVSKGMCVDLAYHHDGDGNPHVHILTTMRAIDEHGKWLPKCMKEYILDADGNRIKLANGSWKSRRLNTTDWDDRGNVEKWRSEWGKLQNRYLEDAGREERVDMRSYERQGNDLVPTIHLGPEASAMENRGIPTMRGDINRDIRKHNKLILTIKNGIERVAAWLEEHKNYQQLRAEAQQRLGPPVRSFLAGYVKLRMDERADWHDKYKIDGISKDMIAVLEAEEWLKKHNIVYAKDALSELRKLEEKRSTATATLRKNEARRKIIADVIEAADTIIEKELIFNEYNSIRFTQKKERYAQEHAEDLAASKRAYAILMKHHGKELAVYPSEFDAELQRMDYEDEAATAELTAMKDDLTMLRNIKRYMTKADPDYVRSQMDPDKKTAQRDELARAQNQIEQRDAERKKEKKHEQTR